MRLFHTIIVLIFWIQVKGQFLDTLGCTGAIGDVKYSILDPDDFRKENGDCWILMAGQSIEGSKLGAFGFSTVPDARGYFLRSYDNRQSIQDRIDKSRIFGESVGTVQNDAVRHHTHSYWDVYYMEEEDVINSSPTMSSNHRINPTYSNKVGSGDTDSDNEAAEFRRKSLGIDASLPASEGSTTERTEYEVRPKNISLWVYIRIS